METVTGYLEIFPNGFGFLRNIEENFMAGSNDIFVPPAIIRKNFLREGMFIKGQPQKQKNGKWQLQKVDAVNGWSPLEMRKHKSLKEQTSINPTTRLNLALNKRDRMGKILNFVTPMGMGQR